ncbi:MAG: DUF5329 family protein [Deltaproteobacteria bacterium]|nr:DUF5329 family protein [Deltaproteobacteria bacterium]
MNTVFPRMARVRTTDQMLKMIGDGSRLFSLAGFGPGERIDDAERLMTDARLTVTHMSFPKFVIFLVLALGLAISSFVQAQTLATAERQKIESLIKHVGELKDAQFIRNGSSYEVSTAVRFLRGKWEANVSSVKTARDFIDKVASFSGTSGKPYLIRFKDGSEIKSQEFLQAELRKLEKTALDRRASDG